ncbi:VWA domain-containing protein [Edaphobacter sp.]|uniref:VWA domain-containing protein n=1 Tax=Edaphobacter sp. TaxID=1934404 RepID=UPI002DBE2873|nr:VWA domain-containing protein [Edaphobacter sp.]HEU5341672.1 VWA domain-containing protein [Edaphobacter sp.]
MLRLLQPWHTLAVLACTTVAAAQAQPPVQSKSPQQPAQSGITLHAQARLVVLDVVVTDARQNPVHNLTAANFTVLEKNAPQRIISFEEHSAMPAAEAAKAAPMPTLPPGIFTNYTIVPPGSAVNVLLLDALNTPMRDQAYVRDQLKQYLNHARPDMRIAIFGLTTRLDLLQGFTSDPDLLKAFVNKKLPKASPLLDDQVGGGGQPEQLSDTLSGFGDPNMATLISNLQQFEAEQQTFKIQLRTRYTLDAMNQLARYLSGIPGRKNLIWFSGSFPLNIMPDGDLADPFAAVASSEKEFRETANLLTLSQVAVYPVDARGLMTSPVFNASNSGNRYARNPAAFSKDQAKFLQQTAEEHMTMDQMAQATGGHAFYNTNGLSQAVAKAIDSGSNYYTITYSPTNTKWDGSFRKISIRMDQPGYTLAYRRGYYAVAPGDGPQNEDVAATLASNAPFTYDPMRTAMMHGGPDPTEIIFKARVLPLDSQLEDQLARGNALNPHIQTKGPYRRYAIDLAADPRVLLSPSSGTYQGTVQFLTYVYDRDGNIINLIDNKIRANLTPAAYVQSLHTGLHWRQEISVPAKGNYFLRIGIHDLIGNRVGAIEVPVAAVSNLPSLSASTDPAPAGH